MQKLMPKSVKPCKWILLFPILGVIFGLFLLSIPVIGEWMNAERNEQAISSMTSQYDRYEDHAEEIEAQLLQARAFNRILAGEPAVIPAEEVLPYEQQLTFDGNGIMGYVDIPKIKLKMLVYHGTSEEVLAAGAGHVENTSLPVGGTSTHTVISGHSGMKDRRAFDNLRKLSEGDRIRISTLGKILDYRVTYCEIVLPEDTDTLQIVSGRDLLTLVTCTPYGVNDHRLLVHAERIFEE